MLAAGCGMMGPVLPVSTAYQMSLFCSCSKLFPHAACIDRVMPVQHTCNCGSSAAAAAAAHRQVKPSAADYFDPVV